MAKKPKFPGINEKFVKKGASGITEKDLDKVNKKSEEIRGKFEKGGPLGRFIDDGKLLISIVKDYINGNYRKIPWWALTAIGFTLLYVFNPIDIIPDVVPVIGLLDDAAVVAICLVMVEQQLYEYKEWKASHS